MTYVFSKSQQTFLSLAKRRMEAGFGAVLLLEGPPGGGKTSFAKALADQLGGNCHYYSGSPDKERDLLYEIDVQGVLDRENAWVEGPAWTSFNESKEGQFNVLLIDEVDKTNPGFDAFLLRLLEEWTFRSPNGDDITADPSKVAVVLTSNGRRKLRPEVLRRCQRIMVPLPGGDRLKKIIQGIAKRKIPEGLLDLVIRIGDAVRKDEEDSAPSPKEIALCSLDLLALSREQGIDANVWREISASWLTKNEKGADHLDKVTCFKWTKAIIAEVQK